MAYQIGDDATAAGLGIVPGGAPANTLDTFVTETRDQVARGPESWKPGTAVPINRGGTGASNAAAARDGLDVPHDATGTQLKFTSPQFDRIGIEAPGVAFPHTLAYLSDIVAPDMSAYVQKAGDTMTGHLLLPNATPATAGYVAAYINGDGRVSKGASSERFKKLISRIVPASLGNIFPALHRFQMRTGDGSWRYGYIAERLAESDDLRPFVVFDADGRPESIDFIALLIAQNAQLHDRVQALEART